jgi:hypothetical protein
MIVPRKKIRVGLVLDLEFHVLDRWVVALTPELVRGMIRRFDCELIWNQAEYERKRDRVDVLVSMEPGWAAPKLRFRSWRNRHAPPIYILYSDPHDQAWRQDYFLDNGMDFVLALYDSPTRHHFRAIPPECMIPFPWAVPDQWIGREPIRHRGSKTLTCFGASQHEAYAVRNWCRTFPFVESMPHSGVENKLLAGQEYMDWLAGKDAAIAAGSDDPRYRLTMPKYFEIAAAGVLLFAQETDDLASLGFRDRENCIIFSRGTFEERAREYLADPGAFLAVREAGREFIRARHALSVRLDFLERHMRERL